jgi:plasmid stabilization system protein ParE
MPPDQHLESLFLQQLRTVFDLLAGNPACGRHDSHFVTG